MSNKSRILHAGFRILMSRGCDDIHLAKKHIVPLLISDAHFAACSSNGDTISKSISGLLLLQLPHDLSRKHIHTHRASRDEMLVSFQDCYIVVICRRIRLYTGSNLWYYSVVKIHPSLARRNSFEAQNRKMKMVRKG